MHTKRLIHFLSIAFKGTEICIDLYKGSCEVVSTSHIDCWLGRFIFSRYVCQEYPTSYLVEWLQSLVTLIKFDKYAGKQLVHLVTEYEMKVVQLPLLGHQVLNHC